MSLTGSSEVTHSLTELLMLHGKPYTALSGFKRLQLLGLVERKAQWLRNLITAGHIAPGDVDGRSIEEVHPDDLRNYTQCYFFAGIGVWSYALRRAGGRSGQALVPASLSARLAKAAGFQKEYFRPTVVMKL